MKTTIISSASSDVGRLKKSLKKMEKSTIRPFTVSKSRDVFYLLGGIVGLRNAGLGWLGPLKGIERECSRV